MPGIKKSFFLFLAGIFVLSPSLNIFAETGSTVLYDKNYSKNIVSSVSEGSPQITVKSEKDSFKIGETFSVDFEISNNPGFSSYGFKVEYDGTVIKPVSASSEECQVEYSYNSKVKNKAIKNTDIKNAVKSKKENDFYFTGFCMSGSGKLTQTTGDGLLFTVDFKVVGDGKSKIDLIGFNDFILSDSDDAKIPVYVKSLIVTAGNGNSGKTDSKNGNTTEKTGKLSNLRNMRPDEEEKVAESGLAGKSDSEGTQKDGGYPDFELNAPTAMSAPVEFRDMANHPWAKDAVNTLSSLGIVKGIGWRTFKPTEFTTRADFMVIVKRFTGIEGEPKLDVYSDVDNTAYYAEAVGVVTRYGLVSGMSGEEFKPKANITRQEVAAILARILEKAGKLQKSNENLLNDFVDGDFVSPYAREYMSDLIGMKIVQGNDKKRLNPVEPITRAEVCVIVKRVYDLIK